MDKIIELVRLYNNQQITKDEFVQQVLHVASNYDNDYSTNNNG
jgi:hypothetical protein